MTQCDVAKLTEFDCYDCRPIINCKVVGCACDYVCDLYCPESVHKNCPHIGKPCRPVMFSVMAYEMIMDGNY